MCSWHMRSDAGCVMRILYPHSCRWQPSASSNWLEKYCLAFVNYWLICDSTSNGIVGSSFTLQSPFSHNTLNESMRRCIDWPWIPASFTVILPTNWPLLGTTFWFSRWFPFFGFGFWSQRKNQSNWTEATTSIRQSGQHCQYKFNYRHFLHIAWPMV